LQTYAKLSATEIIVLVRPAFGRPFFVSEMMNSAVNCPFDLPTKVTPSLKGRGAFNALGPCHFNHFTAPNSAGKGLLSRCAIARKGL
jgi:hypothetical protein